MSAGNHLDRLLWRFGGALRRLGRAAGGDQRWPTAGFHLFPVRFALPWAPQSWSAMAYGRRVPLFRRDGIAAAPAAGLPPCLPPNSAPSTGFDHISTASCGADFPYTAPFFVARGGRLLPQENIRRAQWLGMGLAFAGIVAPVWRKSSASGRPGLDRRPPMLFAAAALWAATTLAIKALPPGGAGKKAPLPAGRVGCPPAAVFLAPGRTRGD